MLYGEDLKSIRLAPAYDIVSTMIYKNSTENMAMKRFDTMVNGFVDAINLAKAELKAQGFNHASHTIISIN